MPQDARYSYPVREVPPLASVRQHLPSDSIDDVRTDVREKLVGSGLLAGLGPGAKIAVTCSSRGFGGFVDLLGGICDAVRSTGAEPFLVPSMGSHGGSTPAGQIEILKRLGVDEAKI